MPTKQLATDAALGAAAGYVATKAMERFSLATYGLESEQDRKHEEAVRPGPPFRLAADNLLSRVAGVQLDDGRLDTAGMALHYLAGLSWTPVYIVLRRSGRWNPAAAGLATGVSMTLILDELVTPAIGASAANTDYPLSTHLRGLVNHVVYGLTVAAVVEGGWKLLRHRP